MAKKIKGEQVTPFQNWKSKLLRDRGLDAPDGRPLYDYRLEEAEFSSLESLLKERLSQYQPLASLGMIGSHVAGFPALFVLYAAEWWRQRYDGSGWSWEPILRDLGADIDGWNQAQRSECVTRGLQDWRLLLRQTGGLRYLGTIALQGGLPMRLLAEAKGGLGRLLRSVLKEAARSVVTINDIQGWVQSLDHYLPRTYRQTEIHVLLAEVVATVLRLKEEAGLTQSAGAVAQIEKRIPSWRERFPLPIGDADAQGLIEQLIQDAAAVRIERQARQFPVERFLEQDQEGFWHLRSSLTLPEIIVGTKLAEIFAGENMVLPRLLDFSLVIADRQQTTSLRRLAGHENYRAERRPLGALDTEAAEEHVLRLSAADGQVWSISAPKGGELDDGLPWVFDARDESPRLLVQGTGSVATNEALVAIPPDWTPVSSDEGMATLAGCLHSPARQLYRVRGAVHFISSQDGTCRIRTGRAEAREESYEWSGQRLWHEFIRPGMAFLGKPRLRQTDEDGRSHPVTGEPGWRPLGTRIAPGSEPVGPVELWYPATGDVKHRARMVILPAAATLRLESLDVGTGCIHLENWGAMSAQVISPDLVADSIRSGSNLAISLKVLAGAYSPEWVEIDVHWPHTPTPARLRLPFPARGARIYKANGQELPAGSLLAANQLSGVRMHGLGGNPASMPRMTLEFRLVGKNRKSIHAINPPRNSVQVEIRLQDYAAEIAHLLANDDSPDASIEAVLRIGGEAATKLRISRYACRMVRDNGRVYLDAGGIQGITSDALGALPVMALRLEAPAEEALRLVALDSQGVATGTWEFATETREAGSWLIFPAPGAELPFRPTLWTINGDIAAAGLVTQAIGLAEPAEREQALDTAIQAMAKDFLETGWEDVERLASQLGHLPLVTLDLWRRFARSPSGMAALVMRFGTIPGGFLERFALELPFSWETVPFIAWRSAIELLKRQCDSWYGEAGGTVFRSHLGNRTAELCSLHPALNNLLGFARAAAVGDVHPEVRAFRHPSALVMLNGMLFSGEQSPLQRLLRNHADVGNGIVQWPTYFNGRVAQARRHPSHASLLCQQDFGFHDGLINLPVLLAIQAATNETGEWFENSDSTHDLRSHMAFDPDWFTDAYDLTMARCLAAGVLNFGVAR
jgi:hypothetical protein